MIYNMSYPRDDQVAAAARPAPAKPAKLKSRAPLGEPLDPNELSRRLQIVLTEQKAKAEKKRRARAEAERQQVKLAPLAVMEDRGSGAAAAAAAAPSSSSRHAAKEKPSKGKASTVTTTAVVAAAPAHNDDSSSTGRLSGEGGGGGKTSPAKLVKTRKLPKADLAAEAAAAAAAAARGPQPYVPREAAAQFTRTTTAVSMRQSSGVHRLSAQALKSHDAAMERTRTEKKPAVPSSKLLSEQQQQQQQQQHHHHRHHQQHPRHSRILEEPLEAEDGDHRHHHHHQADGSLPTHRHTIEGHHNLIRSAEHHHIATQQQQQQLEQQQHNPRRSSMGDMIDAEQARRQSMLMVDFEGIDEEGPIDPATAGEHRVDWTQSDEANNNKSPREHLRSKMSIWALRGRLGSLTKHNRDEKDMPVSPDEKQHRGGGGFFARFKH